MSRYRKSSQGDGHPYLKGWRFWSQNRFWDKPSTPPHVKAYYEEWLEYLRQNSCSMTQIDTELR